MSRTRRIFGGTTLGYVHQAALTLVGLWLTPFLLKRIGQHDFGLWLVAGQLLGYLGLLDLGVISMLPREVAFASGREGTISGGDHMAALVGQVRKIVRWQLPILSAACVLVLWFLPSEWAALTRPLAFVLVAFVIFYPARILLSALQGLQELPFLAKAQIAAWALSTVATIVLVLTGAGLYALVSAWVVGQAVPAIAAWVRLRAVRPDLFRPPSASAPPVGQYFKRSIWVSISQIAQVLLAGSDVLLIGKLLGPAAVVPYVCTGKLVTVFANHPQLLMHAAQPALSELRASESRSRLATIATALTQCMLFMSAGIAVVILAVNHSFVDWWVGPAQYGGWWLTVAFAVMMLLRHWNVATVYTLFCFGYERQISLTSLADGIVTVALGTLLVWKMGPLGVPVASTISVALVSIPLNVRSMMREMDVSTRWFIDTLLPLTLRTAAIGAAAALGSLWLSKASFAGVLVLAVPTALVYAAVIFPLAWSGPVGPYLRMALPMLRRTDGASAVQARPEVVNS
jgi:O-antigen/teichoic acid export membrane protein